MLTDEEKAKIRRYLGWSARWAQFDRALTGSLSAIEVFPAEVDLLREDLAECVRLDAAIVAAETRLKATSVGPIDLNAGEIGALRDRGRTHVARIAGTLGVEVKRDAFGSTLPTTSAGPWGQTGGGNAQRQG